MDNVPDEVLEFILGFVRPYGDLQRCSLVSKRWAQCSQKVISKTSTNLYRAIMNFNIVWDSITPTDLTNTIAKRYSHSAIVHKDSMYIFGGCTCTSTTFNDLWRFNLSTRRFDRLLTMGIYPSPKACASIVSHNNTLILFGGWTHPSPYPLHQTWKLFNELHTYDITQNKWDKLSSLEETPPPMAGHSVTVHKDLMVVFGGLQKHYNTLNTQFSSSNDIWCFDLITNLWFKKPTTTDKPMPRYGQSQIYLDSEHLLIIGGCGGPNLLYSDCWLLTLDQTELWKWRKVEILNKESSPGNLWCNQACKVGDKLVVLSQCKTAKSPMSLSNKWNLPNQIRRTTNTNRAGEPPPPVESDGPQRLTRKPGDKSPVPTDRDINVNGKWGSFTNRHRPRSENNSDDLFKPGIPGPSRPAERTSFNPAENQPGTSRDGFMNVPNQPSHPSHDPKSPYPRHGITPEMSYSLGLSSKGMLAFKNKLSPTAAHSERLRRLDLVTQRLRQYEESFQRAHLKEQMEDITGKEEDKESTPSPKRYRRNQLSIYVLDISQVKSDECCATWLQNGNGTVSSDAPEETILYSFVAGKGELIMFGGIRRDANSMSKYSNKTEQVSNTVHFIGAPRSII